MSWIEDVAHEIKELDVTEKSLRKFGLTVGAIFFALGFVLLWKSTWNKSISYFFVLFGGMLLSGYFKPNRLKNIYKVWMGFAFALGWVVSRFILIILFVFVLTPLAIIAKLFGKKFLDLKFKDGKNSYWIPKEKRKIDYEKMF